MEKKCLECGEVLRGRCDKKFCSDQCRTSYHNRRNRASGEMIRRVNAILRRNHRILSELRRAGRDTVPGTTLIREGFRFGYFTGMEVSPEGKTCYFCYEQGYLPLEGNLYLLVGKPC